MVQDADSSSMNPSWLPSWTQMSAFSAQSNALLGAFCFLLVISICSYFLRHLRSERGAKSINGTDSGATAFIASCKVHHARFLPVESQHSFRYPALYFVVELAALEDRRLDTGRSFAWKGGDEKLAARRTLCSVRPDQYLRLFYGAGSGVSEAREAAVLSSIRLKLAYELHARGYLSSGPQTGDMGTTSSKGWASELGQVWAVTMPSLLGFQGINPLTVYYVYRPVALEIKEAATIRCHGNGAARGAFWLAVLEVHNTFSERHVYILEAGVKEDGQIHTTSSSSNQEHQWTFPRSFHVSPFNTREGSYRLNMRELFPTVSSNPAVQNHDPVLPTIDIRLLLLVPDDDKDTSAPSPATSQMPLRKKLLATLSSHPSSNDRSPVPLTSSNLHRALSRQPFDLFLTTARILYEAAKLHYVRKLDVFGKPEPVNVDENDGPPKPFDGVGLPPPRNAIEPRLRSQLRESDPTPSMQRQSPQGPLLYQPPSSSELQARDRFLAFALYRAKEASISLRIVSTDPAIEDVNVTVADPRDTLTIYVRSAAFYTDLFLQSTPELAFQVGSRVGRRWGVSNVELYRQFFSATDTERSLAGDWKTRSAQKIRKRYLRWACRCGGLDEASMCKEFKVSEMASRHPLDDAALPTLSLGALSALYSLFLAAWLEKAVFNLVGARYARGTEPWLEMSRAMRDQRSGVQTEESRDPWLGLGSVRRTA